MGMASAFFFMEHHDARLAFQPQLAFDSGNRALKNFRADAFGFRRA